MLRQSIRSSQSIAIGFALCVVAAGATGCSEDSSQVDEPAVVPEGVTSVRVTASDTDKLAEQAFFQVNLAAEKVVYRFDYTDGALAYDRIQLALPTGEPVLLSAEIAMVHNGDYGNYPQPDLLQASNKRFSLATNEADFGVLKATQLDQLRQVGFYYDESALKAPKSGPQSTDNCIHAQCEFCFENGTSDPPVTWEAGTYHCYFEEHVWCD